MNRFHKIGKAPLIVMFYNGKRGNSPDFLSLGRYCTLLSCLISCLFILLIRFCQIGLDMVISVKGLQENCIKQWMATYQVFGDLTKAFNTLNGDILWKILEKLACTVYIMPFS